MNYIQTPLPLTPEQLRDVEKRANRHAHRRWRFILMMIVTTSALPVGVLVGGTYAANYLNQFLPGSVAASLGYMGACALCVFLYLRCVWTGYRRPTRQALRDMGYEICVNCGYWLRELPRDSAQCPECGAPRQPITEQNS